MQKIRKFYWLNFNKLNFIKNQDFIVNLKFLEKVDQIYLFIMYSLNVTLTFFLINRWIVSGHFPLSNLYESLLFLSWSFTLIYIITTFRLNFLESPSSINLGWICQPKNIKTIGGFFPNFPNFSSFSWSSQSSCHLSNLALQSEESQVKNSQNSLVPLKRLIGWSITPVTLLTCSYGFFCIPPELQKAESLVPALQSNWLIMHVSVMILSYASLIIGSLFSFSFLLILFFEKNKYAKKILSFNKILEFNRFKGESQAPKNFGNKFQENPIYPIDPINPIPIGGELGRISEVKKVQNFVGFINENYKMELDSCMAVDSGNMGVPNILDQNTKSSKYQNSNILQDFLGFARGDFKTYNSTLKSKRILSLEKIKVSIFLDNLSYRFIGLGFVLLTLGIISGAVWANSAWGSYWSWDPKETWAFITWLTYAIYLHLRISKGWHGKNSALMALVGFFVVWFCYLGVNLFGKGLHSYAFV